jgi:hypothetical protein
MVKNVIDKTYLFACLNYSYGYYNGRFQWTTQIDTDFKQVFTSLSEEEKEIVKDALLTSESIAVKKRKGEYSPPPKGEIHYLTTVV